MVSFLSFHREQNKRLLDIHLFQKQLIVNMHIPTTIFYTILFFHHFCDKISFHIITQILITL